MSKKTREPGTAVAIRPKTRGRPFEKGNPGGPGRPDQAFKERARFWLERSRGLEVLSKIVSGDILEMLGTKDHTLEDGTVVTEMIVGPTANAERIRAFAELRESAGYVAPRAAVELPEGTETFVIIAPPAAKTPEQWLKLHKKGAA